MSANRQPITPFLKWAGGKRWLAPELADCFKGCRTYFEPFLGSGAVFFYHRPERGVLSDKNGELVSCYREIRDRPHEVLSALRKLEPRHSDEFYYEVRAEVPQSDVERAARFLYLNRTCWNGLYRVNKKGQFNVPRGTKNAIILDTDDFSLVSEALSGVELQHTDFERTIDRAGEGDLIFADPPYTTAHNNNGFIKYNEEIFSWEDQIRLADAVERASSRGCAVIVTNANHPDVRDLYEGRFDLRVASRSSVISGKSSGRTSTTELVATAGLRG